MSKVYYQLCRLTGTYIRKNEDDLQKKKGSILKHMPCKGKSVNAAVKKVTEFVGVSFCPRTLRWRSYISINGQLRSLGLYDTDHDAAMARDKVAAKHGRATNLLKRAV